MPLNSSDEYRLKPLERYASFDYCFNYFQAFREQNTLDKLANSEHIEKSCLQLGFYLASWGMLRGSSFLLSKSVAIYRSVVEAVAHANPTLWSIDVDSYTPSNVRLILDFRKTLIFALHSPTDILVTKIILGVFGNVPTFYTYFRTGFGVSAFGRHSLEKIARFYEAHKLVIDQHRLSTLDFSTGQPTGRRYTRAKVIDMIFFIEGAKKA